MPNFRYVLAALLLVGSSSLISQVKQAAKTYSTHQGIPQIQVKDIFQDSRGYIWVCTKGGVAKFNGTSFEILQFPDNSKRHIRFGYELSNGELIFVPNERDGRFFKYDGSLVREVGLTTDLNKSHALQFYNDTFYYKRQDSIIRFDVVQEQVIDTILPRGPFQDYMIVDGNLIVKDKATIYNSQYEQIDLGNKNWDKLIILGSCKDQFIGYGEKTFDDFIEQDFINFKTKEIIAKVRRRNSEIFEIKVFNWQNIFIPDSRYIFHLNASTQTVDTLSLLNKTKNVFLIDNEGSIWNASENGVQYFSETNFQNYTDYNLRDAWFFVPFNDEFLFGNYSTGIHRFSKNLTYKSEIATGEINRIYYAPAKDNTGNLYIACSQKLVKFNGETHEEFPISEFKTPALCAFYNLQNDVAYFGGDKSLIALDQKGNLSHIKDSGNQLSRYIVTIHEYEANKILVGTYNELAAFDTELNSFTKLNDLFSDDTVGGAVTIEVDKFGGLWVGNSNGLFHKSPSDTKLSRVDKNLIKTNVLSLLQIDESKLIIGTGMELMMLDLKKFYDQQDTIIKTFNYRSGFLGQEIAQNGIVKDGDRIWIPSATSLSSVRIDELNFDMSESNVYIHKVNNDLLGWNSTKTYEFEYGVKDVTFQFENVGFNNPNIPEFQYKVEELDDEWSAWSENNTAQFNNLDNGHYTFKVRTQPSSYSEDVSIPEASFDFIISMPLHKRPNFYKTSFFLLMLLLLSYLGFGYFTRKKKLEKESLLQKVKYLQIQTLQSQLNPHFLFNILTTIQSLILNKETEKANTYLISFSKLMRRFLNASVISNLSEEVDQPNEISIGDEIELLQLYLDFEKLQLKEKLQYLVEVDENIDKINDCIPPMIIQPIVENAVKHGIVHMKEKGLIKLIFKKYDGAISVVIEDNGIGVKQSKALYKESIGIHRPLGMGLVYDRINILNTLNYNISISYSELSPSGTRVLVTFK